MDKRLKIILWGGVLAVVLAAALGAGYWYQRRNLATKIQVTSDIIPDTSDQSLKKRLM